MTPEKTYYKVLKNGCSFIMGDLEWSLPAKGKSGQWHEVEGEIVQCVNGLHLTSTPHLFRNRYESGLACFEAEFEGEMLGPYSGHEIVCRKVRLVRHVPWKELYPQGDGTEPKPSSERSPAYQLLAHVWKYHGDTMGRWHTWITDIMQAALRLAIVSGMRFDPDDFASFANDFDSGYWLGKGEEFYAIACGQDRNHRANPSAYHSFEKWRGRKPFLAVRSATLDTTRIRLSVGESFDWHIDFKTQVKVVVAHFEDNPTAKPYMDDQPSKPYVFACVYSDSSRTKTDMTFMITHRDIAEYYAAIRKAAIARETVETFS